MIRGALLAVVISAVGCGSSPPASQAKRVTATTARAAVITTPVVAPATPVVGAGGPPAAEQVLAVLTSSANVFAQPTGGSTRVATVADRRPLTGAPTALPVVGRATGDGIEWLRVALPGRPNGHMGWIRERVTRPQSTSWHLAIDLDARQLLIYERGTLVRSVTVIIGKPSTPTPVGDFFVEELIALGPRDPGGPFALALSARSTVLQEFAGGPGQIGVHGLDNIGGRLGTAVSHGCVRVDNATMRWLVERVRTGTPVTVRSSLS